MSVCPLRPIAKISKPKGENDGFLNKVFLPIEK